MTLAADSPQAIRAKGISLIRKTIAHLEQLNRDAFPTDSSEHARFLLLRALATLSDSANLEPMDPVLLLRQVVELQELVTLVESSSTRHISWPLVGYCDDFWKELFGEGKRLIFYSVTAQHNYMLYRFSLRLRQILSNILPNSVVNQVLEGPSIYCLQLASIEDHNLPLYAIIGHEFGHAIADARAKELYDAFEANFAETKMGIYESLYDSQPIGVKQRQEIAIHILKALATELFCDLVAALLMGPAYILSLYEMSWGLTSNLFSVVVTPEIEDISAHPSFAFRLHSVCRTLNFGGFCTQLGDVLAKEVDSESLRELPQKLASMPVDHSSDKINMQGHPGLRAPEDVVHIARALQHNIARIKESFEAFLDECRSDYGVWYRGTVENLDVAHVMELLKRLEHTILPNIIPDRDNALLGIPAAFKEILNAAAIYRIETLLNTSKSDDAVVEFTGVVERLTGKALEVSFVQQEHAQWTRARDERPQ